ncbi:ATP-binding cassette domain-containing protein [Flammeovirgaceae bacterium SG7u.111]|nr:ATP-binding cassette domain-containing protein [Flammeovirgaceae bacterium SG7u.132]WPO36350.1 ATP-binding cassette domain-containing protein [Flammeovirgaceae bacterium SG7u.111]
MNILLEDIGKRFNKNWIFRHIGIEFESGQVYAITGNNGSGKTTLLKVISGISQSSEGKLSYSKNNTAIEAEAVFKYLTFVGPYTELIEEFSLVEIIDFYAKLKPLTIEKGLLIDRLGFDSVKNRYIKNYSSGMKQKVKLGLALFTQSDLLLLDEPTSNFDESNTNWYLEMMDQQKNKTIIIGSNQTYEYGFCNEVINLNNFKN